MINIDIIVWSDQYSLGIKKIDDQHKKLIQILNDLNRAFYNKDGKEVYQEVLNHLVNYTKEHFGEEEKYFKLYKYEDKDIHITKHNEFIEKVNDFSSTLDKNVSLASIKLLNYLKSWITNHILNEDKKYVSLFKSKGII